MAEQPSTPDDDDALGLPPVVPEKNNFESDKEGGRPSPRHASDRAGGTGG